MGATYSKKFRIARTIFEIILKNYLSGFIVGTSYGGYPMASLRMRFSQRVPPEQLRQRLKVARMYVNLTRTMHQLAFPKSKKGFGAELETMLVLMCVFIGDAEGRPMSASKIASFAGLPRATVYRRLEHLIRQKKIVRVGNAYHYAKDAVSPDPRGQLHRLIDNFSEK
jgi:hypothetical protein